MDEFHDGWTGVFMNLYDVCFVVVNTQQQPLVRGLKILVCHFAV